MTNFRILIIEDEREFAAMMASVLELYGFEVDVTFCGSVAIDRFKSKSYHLLVTDLHVPGLCGLDLIRRIRTINPAQKILVITGLSMSLLKASSPRETLHYLSKPFPVERFVELVMEVLDGSTRYSSVPLSFEDMTRLLVLEGKASVLEVKNNGRKGCVYFKRGEIIHAETDSVKGEEAFRELLSWEKAKFFIVPLLSAPPRSIQCSFDILLQGEKS